jgi:hypothetical protein
LIKSLKLMPGMKPYDQEPPLFEAGFADGTVLILFIDPNDPLKFTQKVRGDDQTLESIDQSGLVTQIPMDGLAEDEIGRH